jgi:hypothetical protein
MRERVVPLEIIGSRDDHYNKRLEKRGGRIAQAFYKVRKKIGNFLVTENERSREELITYHEDLREPQGGLLPDPAEDPDLTPDERDSWRIIGPGF